MNKLTAKKAGELLAFAEIGIDTITKGRTILVAEMGEATVGDMEEKFRIHAAELKRLTEEAGVVEIVETQKNTTAQELVEMRDVYLENDWTNSTQLFEWMGFFEGASIVHWSFVRGSAQTSGKKPLLMLTEEAINYHYELLDKVVTELEAIGAEEETF